MQYALKFILSLPIWLLLTSCSSDSQNTQSTTASDTNPDTATQSTEVLRIAAAANLAGVLPTVIEAYQTSYNQNMVNTTPDSEKQNAIPKIEVTYASSGKLFAQINSGAPYDLFLSADQQFPSKYAQQQQSFDTTSQPFTYARGQLALYSSNQDLSSIKTLNEASLQQLFITQPNQHHSQSNSQNNRAIKITLANPELAPYGKSAKAFLQQQQVYDALNTNKTLIQAENIGQAFQYTHTASTDYGFVAVSQLISAKVTPSKYIILLPASYPPLLQDGIVISDNAAALDFSRYLQSESVQHLFANAGYLPVNAKTTTTASSNTLN